MLKYSFLQAQIPNLFSLHKQARQRLCGMLYGIFIEVLNHTITNHFVARHFVPFLHIATKVVIKTLANYLVIQPFIIGIFKQFLMRSESSEKA